MHYTQKQLENFAPQLASQGLLVADCLKLHDDNKRMRVAAAAVVKARDFLDDEMRNRGKSSRGPVWDAIDDLHAVAGIEVPPGDEAGLKPSDFTAFPCCSVMSKTEAEEVAQNIMAICARRGDRWGELTRDQYESERRKDGYEGRCEIDYFDRVYALVSSAVGAKAFASVWAKVGDENRG